MTAVGALGRLVEYGEAYREQKTLTEIIQPFLESTADAVRQVVTEGFVKGDTWEGITYANLGLREGRGFVTAGYTEDDPGAGPMDESLVRLVVGRRFANDNQRVWYQCDKNPDDTWSVSLREQKRDKDGKLLPGSIVFDFNNPDYPIDVRAALLKACLNGDFQDGSKALGVKVPGMQETVQTALELTKPQR